MALTLLFLPLAHNLNSLHLIATTTCLVLIVLFVDLYGVSCVGTKLVGGGVAGGREGKGGCQYTAHVERKGLEGGEMGEDAEVGMKGGRGEGTEKRGGKVMVEELGRREGGKGEEGVFVAA